MAESKPKSKPKRAPIAKKPRRAGASPGLSSPGSAPPGSSPAAPRAIGWAALAIACVALLVAGYFMRAVARDAASQIHAQSSRMEALGQRLDSLASAQENWRGEIDQTGQLEARLERLERQINSLRDETRAQQAKDDAGHAATRADIDALSRVAAEHQSALSRTMDHWRLGEVEQLLVIANQRLGLAADIELAARALQLADARLRRIPRPALASVRAILADERAALGAVAAVDVAGALNALAALARGVDDLPLAGDIGTAVTGRGAAASLADSSANSSADRPTDSAASPPANQAGGDSWWRTEAKNLLADLGALVQIETDGTPLPILTAELRLMIFEKTKLILESSQLAFLRRHGEVYRARMAAAKSSIEANFNLKDAAVGAWLERLAALAALSPETRLPDISASLRALREAMPAVRRQAAGQAAGQAADQAADQATGQAAEH